MECSCLWVRSAFFALAVLSVAIGHSVCGSVCWGFQEEKEPQAPVPPLIQKVEPARKLDELRGDPIMQIIEKRLAPPGASMEDQPKLLQRPDARDAVATKHLSVGQLQVAEGMIRAAKKLEKEAARLERSGQRQRAKELREIGSSIRSDVIKLLQLGD